MCVRIVNEEKKEKKNSNLKMTILLFSFAWDSRMRKEVSNCELEVMCLVYIYISRVAHTHGQVEKSM